MNRETWIDLIGILGVVFVGCALATVHAGLVLAWIGCVLLLLWAAGCGFIASNR